MTGTPFHPRTRQLMILPGIGLAPREAGALLAHPLHRVPEAPKGCGLVGGVGLGKTWALARHAASRVEAVVQRAPDPHTALLPHAFVVWVNWPEKAEQIKRLSVRPGTDLEDWIDRAKVAGALYLDDLGRERQKGEDDFSLGVLSEILDHRYRFALPVFWTSNLTTPEEFNAVYNARMVSRLLSTWPPFLLKGKDLRLHGQPAPVVDLRARAAGGDL